MAMRSTVLVLMLSGCASVSAVDPNQQPWPDPVGQDGNTEVIPDAWMPASDLVDASEAVEEQDMTVARDFAIQADLVFVPWPTDLLEWKGGCYVTGPQPVQTMCKNKCIWNGGANPKVTCGTCEQILPKLCRDGLAQGLVCVTKCPESENDACR